jgi:hypothetical protein
MRKWLLTAVGMLTWLTAVPLYAAEINVSGELRVRGFWTDNLTDGDSGDGPAGVRNDTTRFNDLRFRLKTEIKAGVSTGVVVLDFGNCYAGTDTSTINGGAAPFNLLTGDCRFGQGGMGQSYNVVGVREAHLKIDLKKVQAVLGRQTVKLGHGVVLDDTVDAITLMFPMNGSTLTASLLQVADLSDGFNVPGADENNDTSIWLLNMGMDHGNHVVNVYDALLWDGNQSALGPTFGNFIYPTGVVVSAPIGAAPSKLWVNFLGVSVDTGDGPTKAELEASYSFGSLDESGLQCAAPRLERHGECDDGNGRRDGGGDVRRSGQP